MKISPKESFLDLQSFRSRLKIKFLLILLLFISFQAIAQKGSGEIVIGQVDSLYSEILKEKRKILLHVPLSNSPAYLLPVVYVLDGSNNFSKVVTLMQHLSEESFCPEMIVVGILNTNRTRDLTPSALKDASRSFGLGSSGGGGENFLYFIDKELKSHLASKYNIAPYKILIGHSLGGLLTVYALNKHPKMFDAYIAIDPSLWWNDQELLKEMLQSPYLDERYKNKKLFICESNGFEVDESLEEIMQDTIPSTSGIRYTMSLANHMKTINQNGFLSKGKYYPDDNHGSVTYISHYDAFGGCLSFIGFE